MARNSLTSVLNSNATNTADKQTKIIGTRIMARLDNTSLNLMDIDSTTFLLRFFLAYKSPKTNQLLSRVDIDIILYQQPLRNETANKIIITKQPKQAIKEVLKIY